MMEGIQGYAEPAAPKQRLWQSMRVLRQFTTDELARVTEVSVKEVSHYLWALCATGFVNRRETVWYAGQATRVIYTLARDTGPLAPGVNRRRNVVRDRNTNVEHPIVTRPHLRREVAHA